MKRTTLIAAFLSFLIIGRISSASFDNGSSIRVREDLFSSDAELKGFEWRDTITYAEKDFFDKTEISLITGGPGNEIWELFGHASFLVEAPARPAVMFDYGIFTFDKSFYWNFALGKLYYSMMESYAEPRLSNLEAADRDTYRLRLQLSPLEKCNLIAFLEYNNRPENRTYLYDYYSDNCATRLRDSYAYVSSGDFRKWAEAEKTGQTLRDYTIRCLSPVFLADWAINYLLGPSVDKEITLWDAMFLPDMLRIGIERFQKSESAMLYSASSQRNELPISVFYIKTAAMSLILVLIILMTRSKHAAMQRTGDILSAIIYLIFFIMSAILLFFETATIHKVTYFNTSILVISPVAIVLSALHISAAVKSSSRKRIRKLCTALLIFTSALLFLKLLLIRLFYIGNWAYYIVIIPVYAAECISPCRMHSRVHRESADHSIRQNQRPQ